MKAGSPTLAYPLIATIFFLQILWSAESSFAGGVSMDTFRKEFEQKTGKSWEMATREEKRDFVRQNNATAQTRETQTANSEGIGTPNQRPLVAGATLKVRTQFKRQTGKDWTEITPAEQKEFLMEFRQNEQKEKQSKERAINEKIAAQRKAEEQKNKEIQEREKAKQRAEAERQKKTQQLAKEREAQRKKLDDAMKRIEKMRQDAQRQHKR